MKNEKWKKYMSNRFPDLGSHGPELEHTARLTERVEWFQELPVTASDCQWLPEAATKHQLWNSNLQMER